MATIGWIKDVQSWYELLDWAQAQKFDDYADNPDSVPFRVKALLEGRAKIEQWDGDEHQVCFAHGFLEGYYSAKPSKAELTAEEQIKRGQTVMEL